MKRSAHPLHSGSPTNAGVSMKPQHLISFTKVFAVYWLPQSWRSATPSATFGALEPKAFVSPLRIGPRAAPARHLAPAGAESFRQALANRFEPAPPVANLRAVPAHDLGRVVINRAEKP